MRRYSRQWFLQAKGWEPAVVSVVLVLVMLLAMLAIKAALNGPPPEKSDHTQTQATVTDRLALASLPLDEEVFVSNFRAGTYGRYRTGAGYSSSFRSRYLAAYRAARDRRLATRSFAAPTFVARSSTDQWAYFKGHDTCASKRLINTPDCTFTARRAYMLTHTLDWSHPVDSTGQRWALRLAWCGGIGVATFWTGGTVWAAIGPGAVGCFGAFFIG